jgi:hypothetical protein
MKTSTILVTMTMTMLLLALPAGAADYTLGVFGNANEDDTINMQDVTYTELIILGYNDATELADAKYDGEIDILDMAQIVLIMLEREAELTVKDAIDRAVTIDQPTEEVVTLFPAATEMVNAYDLNYLIGVDDKSHTDSRFDHLTAVGDGYDPDYDTIKDQLKPDLVITVKRNGYLHPYTLTFLLDGAIPVICIRVLDESKENVGEAYSLLGYIFDEIDEIEGLVDCWSDDAGNDDGILEYSVTTIEDYSDSIMGDLCDGQAAYNALENTLHDDAGWTKKFYEVNDSVDEPDFGTSNSGYQGLDGADFHYHLGHGYNDIGTELCLHDWLPGWNYADVRAQDVEYKWDEDNEWVLLHSCRILADHDDWEHALKHSHALMGFESGSYSDATLVNNFLANAVGNDAMTVYEAYRKATKDAFGSDVTAAVIFDTEEQMDKDHLWGEGVVMPDEDPDDGEYWHDSWNCED